MNGLAGHLADAISEAAEEHLNDRTPASHYFAIKKALESVAQHVADALSVGYEDTDPTKFIKACHIGGAK